MTGGAVVVDPGATVLVVPGWIVVGDGAVVVEAGTVTPVDRGSVVEIGPLCSREGGSASPRSGIASRPKEIVVDEDVPGARPSPPPPPSMSAPRTSGASADTCPANQLATAINPSTRTADTTRRVPAEMRRPSSTLPRTEDFFLEGADSASRCAICLARSSGLWSCGLGWGNGKSLLPAAAFGKLKSAGEPCQRSSGCPLSSPADFG